MQLPTTPFNGVSSQLFPYAVNRRLFRTWFPLTYFSQLTSDDMTKPVYRHVVKAGEGLQFRVGKLNALDYKNPVMDTQQKRGLAQVQSVKSCSINTSSYSWPVLCRDLDLMKAGTPIEDLPGEVTGQLSEVQQKNFSDSMLKAATWGLYGDGMTAPSVVGQMPRTARGVAGNLVSGQANDGKYAYSATHSMGSQLETAMPNARSSNHKLTVKHLRRLKLEAELGGSALGTEDPVKPSRVTMVNGQNSTEYYYFAHPSSISDLIEDPDFKSMMVTRIAVENQPQPISGADYIGKIFGINIYECPMLSQYAAPITNGDCAWNLLIGAGAWAVGWYKFPYVVMDKDVIENEILFCSHEMRGQDVLKYSAHHTIANAPVTKVEQGLVHSFVRI